MLKYGTINQITWTWITYHLVFRSSMLMWRLNTLQVNSNTPHLKKRICGSLQSGKSTIYCLILAPKTPYKQIIETGRIKSSWQDWGYRRMLSCPACIHRTFSASQYPCNVLRGRLSGLRTGQNCPINCIGFWQFLFCKVVTVLHSWVFSRAAEYAVNIPQVNTQCKLWNWFIQGGFIPLKMA